MGFPKKSAKIMGFPAKIWVFAVDFGGKWCTMEESSEAGNACVFTGFPIFLTPANASVEFEIGFLSIRWLRVRVPSSSVHVAYIFPHMHGIRG